MSLLQQDFRGEGHAGVDAFGRAARRDEWQLANGAAASWRLTITSHCAAREERAKLVGRTKKNHPYSSSFELVELLFGSTRQDITMILAEAM
jgi:hypothetical protein